jgi:metal-sulfur cluster biosynthetic enzyme
MTLKFRLILLILDLVYDLKISGEEEARIVEVKMTLTAQGCGMGPGNCGRCQDQN